MTRLVGLVKLLRWNPRDPGTYLSAWATLTMAILVVVFLAMQLWVDVAIVSVFFVISAFFTWLPSPTGDEDEDEDED